MIIRAQESQLEELLERHGDAVYSILRNMCATSSEADELTQQTFVSASRDVDSIRPDGSFRTWLYGRAIKTALAARQRRNATSSPEPLPARFDPAGCLKAGGGRWLDLDDAELAGTEIAGRLRETLERIDDGVRAAFVLCDLAELPAKEAASILRTSPEEIRRRIHRARLMLLGALDGWFSARTTRRGGE